MEKIDQELLIKDICSRLPYGVYVKFQQYDNPLFLCMKDALVVYNGGEMIDTIQYLYLRPMSSMTKEEKNEYINTFIAMWDAVDWLNAHHFDYHSLIEKGLALEAPEGMYKRI